MLFEAALAGAEFKPVARKVRAYAGKTWTDTGHDLDRVFERDGIAYGAEIKNTLPYIPRYELEVKMKMCKHLGLRPLFIVRMAPKNYINDVQVAGGWVCTTPITLGRSLFRGSHELVVLGRFLMVTLMKRQARRTEGLTAQSTSLGVR